MIRILTAGESHGPLLTAIMEGFPAGLQLDIDKINLELARRQKGYGSGGRMRIESDQVKISSGVMGGITTGGPISMLVENKDYKNWSEREIPAMTTPRPGHADLTGTVKYGYPDLRYALERASARETTMRVAVGAICKQFLDLFGVRLGGYITQIGEIAVNSGTHLSLEERANIADANEFRSPQPESLDILKEEIQKAMKDQDTLGGIMEIFATGVPPGLGTYVQYDRRLDAQIASAMISIPAMKGIEFANAFTSATMRGSQVHDEIMLDKDNNTLKRKTNRAGGVEGGISNGEPIVFRVAMKPISTVVKGFASVNLATGKEEKTVYERSDFCALPRAIPIAEAMLAIVLTNALLEKLGGDNILDIQKAFQSMRKLSLQDLPMKNKNWKFNYLY